MARKQLMGGASHALNIEKRAENALYALSISLFSVNSACDQITTCATTQHVDRSIPKAFGTFHACFRILTIAISIEMSSEFAG